MNANDVIESYVTDVAVRLPRDQRNDVAFELRALLDEGLQAHARDAGREVDAAMAIEFVRTFGGPAEVAARYRPTLTIIDPADGHTFLRATVIGLAIIWGVGLLASLQRPLHSVDDVILALGQWWGAAVIPSLWWPGVLVVGFGLAARGRRRRPQISKWQPRPSDRIHGGRSAMVMGLIGILYGVFVLIDPRWLLLGSRAAPAAQDALTYTDLFRRHEAPWLLALLVLHVLMLITVIVKGRWSPLMQRIEVGLGLLTCAALTWIVVAGPMMIAPGSDRMARGLIALIVVYALIAMGIRMRQRISPTPNQQIRA